MSKAVMFTAGILGLGIFYVIVLHLALNPNVSKDYRAYYIERTAKLSPTQIKYLKPYEWGTVLIPQKTPRLEGSPYPVRSRVAPDNWPQALFEGWEISDDAHTAAEAKIPIIVFSLNGKEMPLGALEFRASVTQDQQVSLSLNGHLLGQVSGESSFKQYRLTFDPNLVEFHGTNILQFGLAEHSNDHQKTLVLTSLSLE